MLTLYVVQRPRISNMNQPDDTRAGLSHDRRRAGEQRGSVDALPRSSIARKTGGGNHPVVGREYARSAIALPIFLSVGT